ncbi:Toll-like receptor 7 [Rhizoctonia solani]|uniref:Toll-like receptor 7 n=1 Tax=Rhizoctonia solani TaxID=456999 RepID=A0A0K6GCR9_9AGAM|nr:Toll-like receptor 7 [Rhizoctonia solani]
MTQRFPSNRHLDIWDLILQHLYTLGHGRKSTFVPLLTVSQHLSSIAVAHIWRDLDGLYPLLALFYDRTTSYHDWEWNAIAQTTRCLSAQNIGPSELQTGLANWNRFEHYAAHVNNVVVKIDGAYRNWVFLLPIKRLAATRHREQIAVNGHTLDYFPPLLPNLVSLTFELQYSQNLDHAIAVLTAPSTQLLGVEALAGLLMLMPSTIRHLGLAWNNSISDLFTTILDRYTAGLGTPASRADFESGLVASDFGFFDTYYTLPGDYLCAIPRSSSLVSFRGFSASPHMIEVLALLPQLSEIALYHMPGHEPIPFAHEYPSHLPSLPSVPFPALTNLQILACHNGVEEIHRILTHFPIERLHRLELEFARAYGTPPENFMEPLYALIGNRGIALRALSLVFDAEKWDYIPPVWDVENGAYAFAPWSSLSRLFSCHQLESIVIKCAGIYHGLALSSGNIQTMAAAWPRLSKLCISETLLGVDVVKQSARPRLVDMRGLAELALAFPLLKTLHITLDVDHASTFEHLPTSHERPHNLSLDLDLGYSPLAGDAAEEAVARQLLSIWPGLRSLQTYWKEHRPVGVHAIYLRKWREVIRYCGPSVVDGHNINKCRDGYEEQAYWRAI